MDAGIEKKTASDHSPNSDNEHADFVDALAHAKEGDRHASVVAQNILKHSHDADAAFKAFADHQGAVLEIDEATNRRLLRKIDWHLMPVSLKRAIRYQGIGLPNR